MFFLFLHQILKMKILDTICALSTPSGIGAIAVIRVSGNHAFDIVSSLFRNSSKFLEQPANYAKFLSIYEADRMIDQTVVVKFVAPHSYTGEDLVEISCHGSQYIQQKILELLLKNGARMANPGEFSMRAFLNNKLDLPQTEAVADLIESQSEMAHKLAVGQLKGGFSSTISNLRTQFVELAALLELELDFSEEDVEFVDRTQLLTLLATLKSEVASLVRSFKWGNNIKNGIPVAIVGKPNVGKSTLLNALLNEERAIVSHIPGTTRDTIEDTMTIQGVNFRFVDTAGIRNSEDIIESLGIDRTFAAIEKAEIILFMVDISQISIQEVQSEIEILKSKIDIKEKNIILLANKIDKTEGFNSTEFQEQKMILLSAKSGTNVEQVKERLVSYVNEHKIIDNALLTNVRHYDIFLKIADEIVRLEDGFAQQLPTDILAIHLNTILHYLGEITGEVTTDEILNDIFGKFCIGK
mgnify:CR=1 FL=1